MNVWPFFEKLLTNVGDRVQLGDELKSHTSARGAKLDYRVRGMRWGSGAATVAQSRWGYLGAGDLKLT